MGCIANFGCSPSTSPPENQHVEHAASNEVNSQPVTAPVLVENPQQNAESPVTVSEVIKLPIADIWKQVQKDREAANRKYEGKTLEITGRVLYFSHTQGRNDSIVMHPIEESERKDSEFYTLVSFYMISNEPWKQVLPGQIVTLRAPWTKLSVHESYEDCEIKSVSGDPPGEFFAEELAELYEMIEEPDVNPDAVRAKFKSKNVVVTGKIKSIEYDEKGDFSEVAFETAHGTGLKGMFQWISRTAPQKLEVGQTVRFVGQYDSTMSQEKLIYFDHCIPLEMK